MTAFKVIKDKENEYYIQVKRKNQYPFTIHKRFYSRESALKFIKLNKKKYK